LAGVLVEAGADDDAGVTAEAVVAPAVAAGGVAVCAKKTSTLKTGNALWPPRQSPLPPVTAAVVAVVADLA
jgi:hypothetical protein